MDAWVEKIKGILEQQIGGYKELLQLLQKEKQCLMGLEAEAIEELSKQKDTVVLKLRLLEQERIRLLDKAPAEYAVGGGTGGLLGLREIAARTGDVAFQTLRVQLICLLQSIAELNEFNRILIDRSLAVVNGSLESLGVTGPAGGRSKGMVVSRNI